MSSQDIKGAQFKAGDRVYVDPELSPIARDPREYEGIAGCIGTVEKAVSVGGNGMPYYLVRFPIGSRYINQEWLTWAETGLDVMLEMIE